jgi:hypothetical protein
MMMTTTRVVLISDCREQRHFVVEGIKQFEESMGTLAVITLVV